MSTSVSPITQAQDARAVAIADVTASIAAQNARLKSEYAQAVLQWIFNDQQQAAGVTRPPVPVPPASWIAVPHKPTAMESLWDTAYPGLPAMIDDSQTGPPVCAQYVPSGRVTPAPVTGTVVHVGQFLRDGEYAALPDDNMPNGYVTRAPDGTFVRKMTNPTPFGVAQWYQAI